MSDWTPHGKVKRMDAEHFAIVTRWGKRIVSQVYHYQALDPNPAVGSPAIRLTKTVGATSGESYDLIRRPHGWDCECPRFARYGKCKHLAAARAIGLIGAQ